jgi:hypothetical protein
MLVLLLIGADPFASISAWQGRPLGPKPLVLGLRLTPPRPKPSRRASRGDTRLRPFRTAPESGSNAKGRCRPARLPCSRFGCCDSPLDKSYVEEHAIRGFSDSHRDNRNRIWTATLVAVRPRRTAFAGHSTSQPGSPPTPLVGRASAGLSCLSYSPLEARLGQFPGGEP